jgi:hypothetical protein
LSKKENGRKMSIPLATSFVNFLGAGPKAKTVRKKNK